MSPPVRFLDVQALWPDATHKNYQDAPDDVIIAALTKRVDTLQAVNDGLRSRVHLAERAVRDQVLAARQVLVAHDRQLDEPTVEVP